MTRIILYGLLSMAIIMNLRNRQSNLNNGFRTVVGSDRQINPWRRFDRPKWLWWHPFETPLSYLKYWLLSSILSSYLMKCRITSLWLRKAFSKKSILAWIHPHRHHHRHQRSILVFLNYNQNYRPSSISVVLSNLSTYVHCLNFGWRFRFNKAVFDRSKINRVVKIIDSKIRHFDIW